MSDAALPASAAPLGPVRGTDGRAGFVLYLLGLFGTCIIVWWGVVSLGWWWTGTSGFGLGGPWISALPYLSAWAVLTFASPWKALLAVLAFPIVLSVTWLFGLLVGIMSLPLLFVPGYVSAAVATGGFLLLAQRLDRRIRMREWALIHLGGSTLVGIAVLLPAYGGGKPFAWTTFWLTQAPVMVALCLHAVWCWAGLRREGRARVSPLRVGLLVGAAYLGIGVAFAAGLPSRSLLTWPAAPWHDPIVRARNGQWFVAGETIAVRGIRSAETFSVPEGWRVRPDSWPTNFLRMEPLDGMVPGFGPSVLALSPSADWLPDTGGEPPRARPRTRFVRCTAQPPAPPGLVLCRRQPAIHTLPEEPDFLAWDGLELEFVLGPGVGDLQFGSYLVLGPALRGACRRGERCSLWLPLAGGGSVRVDVAEADIADVERVRVEVEALLRSTGAAAIAPTREGWPGLR